MSTAHSRQITGELVRVLLVEDDDGDALLVEELLRDAGAPSRGAPCAVARRGGARCSRRPFDCVLLDLGLPDATGSTALRAPARGRADVARSSCSPARRRAARHRGRRRRRPGLPRQGQRRRRAAAPRDPLRRRAQPGRRVRQQLRAARDRGRGERPPGARPAARAAARRPGAARSAPATAPAASARCSAATSTTSSSTPTARVHAHDRRRLRATAPTRRRSASACGSPGAR